MRSDLSVNGGFKLALVAFLTQCYPALPRYRPVMRTELVSIPTDTLPLDGAFYEPNGGATAGGVLLFHGNTMNFYVGAPRFLPPALTALGFACLAFNRRGHDILSIRNSRAAEGAAFQTTAEGIADNRYAARWMAIEVSRIPSSSATATAGCWRCSMWPTTRKHRRWCCSRRIPVERGKSRPRAAPGSWPAIDWMKSRHRRGPWLRPGVGAISC